ncbi:MAG: NADH-quinone oxidoreductase subunit A [Anaerolineales bacterium]|nr:NADH-quinone oxidoreductase subunit A [Anaerolineales bacterium]
MQQQEWIFIAMFFVIAPILPAVPVLAPQLLRLAPRRSNPLKMETYECGIETMGDAWVQFKVQYYLYALIFLIFDIEMIFLFPWAVAYNQLPLFAIVVMIAFIAILGVGLVYAWRKGALEWQ